MIDDIYSKMKLRIKNCTNIDNGEFEIIENTLNIKGRYIGFRECHI